MMIHPGTYTDTVGLVVLAVLAANQLRRYRQEKKAAKANAA